METGRTPTTVLFSCFQHFMLNGEPITTVSTLASHQPNMTIAPLGSLNTLEDHSHNIQETFTLTNDHLPQCTSSAEVVHPISSMRKVLSYIDILFPGILSSGKLLTPEFKKIIRFHGLKEEPVVVGAYNDLVLCCASHWYQLHYYICNPYTTQWVALPPPPRRQQKVLVGLICDVPYYNYKDDDEDHLSKGYSVQPWAVVQLSALVCSEGVCVWASNTLFFWELKEEEDHCDMLVVDGAAKLCFKHKKTVYPLDQMFTDHDDLVVELIAFDPNDEDSLYLNVNGHIVVCNIITRRWSKVASFESDINVNSYFYQFVLP
ncbi:hypothetical protein GBA52_026433 [Prunus armeniaca]|nr:hypothetical protein GBA52_026433 [Prunus armeniaca]